MGSLIVYLKNSKGNYMQVWEKQGHQGNYWKVERIPVGRLGGKWKIYIQATIGIVPNSDIAIDDIYFDDGPCVSEKCEDEDERCNP